MIPISQSLVVYKGVTFTFFFVLRDPQISLGPFTVNTSTNVIALTGHGLVFGDPVQFLTFDNGVLPAPLSTGITYYVIAVGDADHFQISPTYGGFEQDFITAGSGTIICLTERPIDLTGWSVFSNVRPAPAGSLTINLAPEIDVDPTTGKIDMSKTDEQTALYTAGNYLWDLLVEDNTGQILGPVFAGNFQVKQPITEP